MNQKMDSISKSMVELHSRLDADDVSRSVIRKYGGEPFRKTNVSASNPLTVFGDLFEELYSIPKER